MYQVKDIMVLCSNSISGKKVEVEGPTNHDFDRNLTQQLEMGGFLFIFDMFMPFLQPLYLEDKVRGRIQAAAKHKYNFFLRNLDTLHCLLKEFFDIYSIVDNALRYCKFSKCKCLIVILTLSTFSTVYNLCVEIFLYITI